MPVFHRSAYEAAIKISGRKVPIPRDSEFDEWESTFSALDQLTEAERCDALYADWVMQLWSPGGKTQLQIRNLLLQRGALAANYLAELAQNADDASDGEEAKLVIHYEAPWLIVGNNGRKVTSSNLLGLCRFFVHWGRDSAEDVQELNEGTIGKFGIGFKSCYRIAREVLVTSWDGDGEYAFRLPIVSKGDSASLAEVERWQQIRGALLELGHRVKIPEDHLGYCTPEYLNGRNHPALKSREDFCPWPRGTLFRFHLHQKGQKELEERFKAGAKGLYELCPLFLPNIREIKLNGHQMAYNATRSLKRDAEGLKLEAQRATLTSSANGNSSNDRFWLLKSTGKKSKWQLAVSADSSHGIRVERYNDDGFHLGIGGAYAYFPLNDVNTAWNLAIHLHIDLPTNLARSNWNDDEAEEVKQQIVDAAKHLAEWLEKKNEIWHPEFSVQDLFPVIPQQSAKWARLFYETFRSEADKRTLFRTFNGVLVRANDASSIRLNSLSDIKSAAKRIGELMSGVPFSGSYLFEWDTTSWDLNRANQPDLIKFFKELIANSDQSDAVMRDITLLLLAVENTSPRLIEAISKDILVLRADGNRICLADLLRQIGGMRLQSPWHELFRFADRHISPSVLNQSVHEQRLRTRLQTLTVASDIIEWKDVANELNSEESWDEKGESFWEAKRPTCPKSLKKEVLQYLRTKDAGGRWQLISSKWLFDPNYGQCFLGMISRWRTQYKASELEAIQAKVKNWGLWDVYAQEIDEKLESFSALLNERLNQEFDKVIGLIAQENFSGSLTRLQKDQPARFALVKTGIKEGFQDFLDDRLRSNSASKYFSGSPSFEDESEVLDFLGYQPAGNWLSENSRNIYKQYEVSMPSVKVVGYPLNKTDSAELGQELLENAYQLKNASEQVLESVKSLEHWFEQANGDWQVRLTRLTRREFLRNCVAIAEEDPLLKLLEDNGDVADGLKNKLPLCLSQIQPIRETAISFDSATVSVLSKDSAQPIVSQLIGAEIREHPIVVDFIQSRPNGEVMYMRPLEYELKTRFGETILVRKVKCVVEDEVLYVSAADVGDDKAYDDKLAVYLSFHADKNLKALRDRGDNPRKLYQKFRKQIVSIFRKELVDDIGYKRSHILRELLQNAESAYASKDGITETTKSFKVTAKKVEGRSLYRMVIEHYGRSFNAKDKDGNARNDIDRIISQGNKETDRTEREVGRFNRGFKSVFHVADRVLVRSGPYAFQIRDLLMLEPTNPKPDQEEVTSTQFSFECTSQNASLVLGGVDKFKIFNPSYFVFLRELSLVTIESDSNSRRWTILRDQKEKDWRKVNIRDSEIGNSVEFLVKEFQINWKNGGLTGSVGIQVDKDGFPTISADDENKLYLTFPTEDQGFGHFLLNGLFDTDKGRIGIRLNAVAAAILSKALEVLLEESRNAVRTKGMPAWLAWARCLNPVKLSNQIEQRLPKDSSAPLVQVKAIQAYLQANVPHDGGLFKTENLIFPSATLRRLAKEMGDSFPAGHVDLWVEDEVHEVLKKFVNSNLQETTLRDWVQETELSESQISMTVGVLKHLCAKERNLAVRTEIEAALGILGDDQDLPAPQSDIAELIGWWGINEAKIPYTIDGFWWEYLVPKEHPSRTRIVPPTKKLPILKELLNSPESGYGKLVWYRFLSIAALLSAGRRVSEIQGFIKEDPNFKALWSATNIDEFKGASEEAFHNLTESAPRTQNAGGEYAYLWRRVFYDIRKIHYIVHKYEFAESVMELCKARASAAQVLRFMRGGVVDGDSNQWAGVIGQTASSTLLFILRELRRLEVYKPKDDSHCYFMCRPVRRVAVHFGILEEAAIADNDLESLLDHSKTLHEFIQADEAARECFAGLYDIPFLHYGQENSL